MTEDEAEKPEEPDQEMEEKEDNEQPASSEKYCKSCGEIIDEEAEICPECGVRQREPNQNVNVEVNNQNNNVQSTGSAPAQGSKNKILAALLALFLGNFGVHKFYLGQAGQGILYLIFFWTFIPALLALVDALRYLLMSTEKFHRVYG
jgi:TM2 domain-containing membrane protein YozV